MRLIKKGLINKVSLLGSALVALLIITSCSDSGTSTTGVNPMSREAAESGDLNQVDLKRDDHGHHIGADRNHSHSLDQQHADPADPNSVIDRSVSPAPAVITSVIDKAPTSREEAEAGATIVASAPKAFVATNSGTAVTNTIVNGQDNPTITVRSGNNGGGNYCQRAADGGVTLSQGGILVRGNVQGSSACQARINKFVADHGTNIRSWRFENGVRIDMSDTYWEFREGGVAGHNGFPSVCGGWTQGNLCIDDLNPVVLPKSQSCPAVNPKDDDGGKTACTKPGDTFESKGSTFVLHQNQQKVSGSFVDVYRCTDLCEEVLITSTASCLDGFSMEITSSKGHQGCNCNERNAQGDCLIFLENNGPILCGPPPNGINTIPVPPQLGSTDIFSGDSVQAGDSYQYQCIPGYETNDELVTYCGNDGAYSLAAPPVCYINNNIIIKNNINNNIDTSNNINNNIIINNIDTSKNNNIIINNIDTVTTPKCGDGVVDVAAGEQCDDGNTLDGDDCSSTCKVGPQVLL